MIISTPLPSGKFDYISNLPQGAREGLRQEMKRKFGLVGRSEMIETNVLVLNVRSTNAPGLKPCRTGATFTAGPNFISSHGQKILAFVDELRSNLGTIVIDRTGLQDGYDIDLKWDSTPEGLKQALLQQLGMELVPEKETLEFWVIEKSKYQWQKPTT